MLKQLFSIAALLGSAAVCQAAVAAAGDTLSLAGEWRFQLDPMGFGTTPGSELYLAKLSETINLPGSTDEAGRGVLNTASYVDRLSRKYEYCGPAWYQREVVIPDDWEGRDIVLDLERAHWGVTVWVDGNEVGSDERLSTPDRFNLTPYLTPGMHTVTLMVDNRLRYPMDQWTHGTTEYTQTNWNGIVGRMALVARPATHIGSIQIYPDIDNRSAEVAVTVAGKPGSGSISLSATDNRGRSASTATGAWRIAEGDSVARISITLPMGRDMKLWDEHSPHLYTLSARLDDNVGNEMESLKERFGMRKVEQGVHHVRVNGIDRHLRGVLDCAAFPLTGYPSTDTADWLRIMSTIRSYGMNHIRFHSWCPPEAAFEAADSLGMYLQVELPMWIKDVGQYPARRDFFEDEMMAILDEYGNHPSFILYCNGNENEGDFAVLEDLIVKGKKHDPRHLYSASTARTHVAADQFYTSHVASKGKGQPSKWITVYEGRPATDWDLNEESAIDDPVIAHETGQRCMYPNFEEMKKYTGVLAPRNFGVYRERLARNGMLGQAGDFFRATGAHTVAQYKEVNEALLRTSTSGGFQLLGLADFPGQGCAFVGVLDPFWESKGLVEPEKFRESCGPTVLLARMPRRIYTPADTFAPEMEIYNYGASDIPAGKVNWTLADASTGAVAARGAIRHGKVNRSSVDSIGRATVKLAGLAAPARYTFRASTADGSVGNEWDIWVLPADGGRSEIASRTDSLTVTRDWAEARKALEEGGRVLFLAYDVPGRKTHFASHFWNPVMFNWDPMIVGTLIDNDHPAFASFPTDNWADWQWYDILNNARAMDLTEIEGLTPVIQSIDSYEHNRKLGVAYEARVGNGRLFVLGLDTDNATEAEAEVAGRRASTALANRPASRQLLRSVADYVASDRFAPAASVQMHQLDAVFTPAPDRNPSQESSSAVRQLLNQ